MDYSLLMRRVMAQLALVAHASAAPIGRSRPSAGHPSRLLTEAQVIRDDASEIVYASPYWLQARWHRATSDKQKAEVLRIALSTLRVMRIRTEAKHDMATADGRLAVGRKLASGEYTIEHVMATYDYSRQHAYKLRDQAARHDEAAAAARVRKRCADYTLNERCLIAADPRSSYAVAAEFGISPATVQNWRRDVAYSTESLGTDRGG